MINEDLSGLLAPPDGPEFGFRQGVIVAFGLIDGTSTVDVGGTLLTDLPFLNPGGYTIYQTGDVVVLVRMKSSWAILGRITNPGGTKAIGRYTEISGPYSSAIVTNFAVTTADVVQADAAITVPAWAEVATVTVSLMLLAKNTTGAEDFLYGRIDAGGGFVSWPSSTAPAGKYVAHTVTYHHAFAVTPGGSINITGAVRAGAAWTADASNTAYLQATIAWNSNDGS